MTPTEWDNRTTWMVAAGVTFAAVFARLPVFDTWWCLDDWGQLARPAGLLAAKFDPWPARWLSQHLWWQLAWPVFGLNVTAHAVSRLALYILASVTIAGIARRLGRSPLESLAAGTLFAVTPIAFTPLFWASGIQELLAVALALLAMERWLVGGRTAVLLAGLYGLGSILAKEPGFGLSVIFAAYLIVLRSRDRTRWAVVGALALAVVLESLLIIRHFEPAAQGDYRLITPLQAFGNLGLFARWMTTLGPRFEAEPSWPYVWAGLGMFAAWAIVGIATWRRGMKLPLAACAASIFSLGPALLLATQARPYLATLAMAPLVLTVALPLGRLKKNTFLIGAVFIAGAAAIGYVITLQRIHAQTEEGRPADPIVRAADLARSSMTPLMNSVDLPRDARLVVYQPPIRPEDFANRSSGGRRLAAASPRFNALGKGLGPALMLHTDTRADWVGDLDFLAPDAVVLCETGSGLIYWGGPEEALVYGGLLHVVLGHFDLSREYFEQALARDSNLASHTWDLTRIPVPPTTLHAALTGFDEWLAEHGDAAPLQSFMDSLRD